MKTYAQTPEGAAKLKTRAKERVYTPEQKARQNEAIKAWEKAHPEERAAIGKRYRENHKEEMKERSAQYVANNPEKVRYIQRTYHQKPEIKERNRLRMLAYRKTEAYRVWDNNRSGQRYRDYKKMTKDEWLLIVDAFESCCAYCGHYFPLRTLQMEHMFPRVRGGWHGPGNVVPACKPCNSMKNDKSAHEFALLPWAPEFDPEEIGWISLIACLPQEPMPPIEPTPA